MNIQTRLRDIEKRAKLKTEGQKIIVVTENNGKYYQDIDGQQLEFKGDTNDPNLLLIVIKSEEQMIYKV